MNLQKIKTYLHLLISINLSFFMKFFLGVILMVFLLSCSNNAVKSNERIIAEEEAQNFKIIIEQLESALKKSGKFEVKPLNKFEKECIINKIEAKKAYNIRYHSTLIGVNLRCYNYNEFDGASIVKENYFNKVKQFKQNQVLKGLFVIFNNYNVVTLDYKCENYKRKDLAKDLIPIIYGAFKLPDSKILNLECGKYIKDDAELH